MKNITLKEFNNLINERLKNLDSTDLFNLNDELKTINITLKNWLDTIQNIKITNTNTPYINLINALFKKFGVQVSYNDVFFLKDEQASHPMVDSCTYSLQLGDFVLAKIEVKNILSVSKTSILFIENNDKTVVFANNLKDISTNSKNEISNSLQKRLEDIFNKVFDKNELLFLNYAVLNALNTIQQISNPNYALYSASKTNTMQLQKKYHSFKVLQAKELNSNTMFVLINLNNDNTLSNLLNKEFVNNEFVNIGSNIDFTNTTNTDAFNSKEKTNNYYRDAFRQKITNIFSKKLPENALLEQEQNKQGNVYNVNIAELSKLVDPNFCIVNVNLILQELKTFLKHANYEELENYLSNNLADLTLNNGILFQFKNLELSFNASNIINIINKATLGFDTNLKTAKITINGVYYLKDLMADYLHLNKDLFIKKDKEIIKFSIKELKTSLLQNSSKFYNNTFETYCYTYHSNSLDMNFDVIIMYAKDDKNTSYLQLKVSNEYDLSNGSLDLALDEKICLFGVIYSVLMYNSNVINALNEFLKNKINKNNFESILTSALNKSIKDYEKAHKLYYNIKTMVDNVVGKEDEEETQSNLFFTNPFKK